jgi:hypothetical protein
MNDQAGLERGYRRLLACYPRSFRRDSQEEVLAVLLASAHDGQQRPGLAESADLIRGAVRMHLGLSRSPRTVLAAVRLMYLGAAAELAALIAIAASAGAVRAALVHQGLGLAAWHTAATHISVDKVAAPIAIVVWLFLAWANGRGHDWARYLFASFFGLLTLGLLQALAGGAALLAPADMATGGLAWLIALAATVLVFNKRSSSYYNPGPAPEPVSR